MKTVQKYEEIEQYILNLIAEQNLKPGNKIPTEIEYVDRVDILE